MNVEIGTEAAQFLEKGIQKGVFHCSVRSKKGTFLVENNDYCSFWDDVCFFLPNESLLGSNDLSCPGHIRDLQPASPTIIPVFFFLSNINRGGS